MAGDKLKSYAESMIERARELRESDAFAPPDAAEAIPASAAGAKRIAVRSVRTTRRWIIAFAVICIALIVFSLHLGYISWNSMGGGALYSTSDVLDTYGLWFRMNVLPLFDTSLINKTALMYSDFVSEHDSFTYTLLMNRVTVTIVVVGVGMLLAVSGLLFQSAFRNPLAAPSSLGVSDGVTLGCVIFAMLGYSGIDQNQSLYLLLVYVMGAATVVVVLLLSRFMSGGARYNVLDMLLLGTVICQLVGGIGSFVQNFVMDYLQWNDFYMIQTAGSAVGDPLIQTVFAVVFVCTFVPALILRFRLNMISFSNEEGTMMGVRAGLLRGGALALGSAMQLTAIATIGQVAVLSMAIPFLVRYMMPADFKSQFLGNCLVGTAVLLACMIVQNYARVGIITMPIGTIVSLFIIPFFIWMMALGRGRW